MTIYTCFLILYAFISFTEFDKKTPGLLRGPVCIIILDHDCIDFLRYSDIFFHLMCATHAVVKTNVFEIYMNVELASLDVHVRMRWTMSQTNV